MMDEILEDTIKIMILGVVAIIVVYIIFNIGSHDLTYAWTDVTMNPNTFCIANGYNYGQPYAANGTYDNVKCYMNTSDDQSSFKTYRIWNTTRTINDTYYVYCNGEPIYTVD
jgi:hypothetical protein